MKLARRGLKTAPYAPYQTNTRFVHIVSRTRRNANWARFMPTSQSHSYGRNSQIIWPPGRHAPPTSVATICISPQRRTARLLLDSHLAPCSMPVSYHSASAPSFAWIGDKARSICRRSSTPSPACCTSKQPSDKMLVTSSLSSGPSCELGGSGWVFANEAKSSSPSCGPGSSSWLAERSKSADEYATTVSTSSPSDTSSSV
mmetsp:Transcript_1735/g.5579  ORF Transcript_1735/g.5579 Transcript_1735/m.5579 type:complete len:201 (+) Transcript_1735:1420-2022(+)